jgi:hypothetical protein
MELLKAVASELKNEILQFDMYIYTSIYIQDITQLPYPANAPLQPHAPPPPREWGWVGWGGVDAGY